MTPRRSAARWNPAALPGRVASILGVRPLDTLDVGRPGTRSRFLRDEQSPILFGWTPRVREPLDEHREAWQAATSKAIDSMHNSGWLAGGIDQAIAAINGTGLALNAKPDPALLGGERAATEWARDVELRFEAWANNAYSCDIYGRQTLGQMCAQGTRWWFGTGEIVGVVRFKRKPGNTHGTKIMLLPSTRINEAARSPKQVQGVVLDNDGAPVAMCLTIIDPRSFGTIDERVVPFRDALGRPQVIHIHDSPPTVVRGLTCLAPVLKVVRQYDQLANAKLTQALIQAILAATITSDEPTEDLLTALQSEMEQSDSDTGATTGQFSALMSARAQWYEKTKFDLGVFGKIIHMFPSEELKLVTPTSPDAHYKDFARSLLRETARCIGITYEQFTGDREGATYSSERMGSAEQWPITLYRRKHITGRLAQTAYEAWLEEDIELGNTKVPGGLAGFLANRDRYTRADWRGPAKPTADDLKTAKANEVKLKNGIISREIWSAEEGLDWEDVDDQRKREQDNVERLELNPPDPKIPNPADDVIEERELTEALMSDDPAAVDAVLTR
jgi:lambda family phage portal protein